ncbi:MAG: amino acid adenylation domain-containing protein [Acidobacteriota bacterium]
MTADHFNPSEAPSTTASNPPAPSAEERHRIAAWNRGPDLPPDAVRRLEQLVFVQAEASPEAPAVARGDEVWSYRQLVRRARVIAHHLGEEGLENGARVGILCRREPEMVAAILGVLEAGCAYIPLDPTYPADRLAFMLADSGAGSVLAHRELAEVLPETAPPVLALEDLPQASEDLKPVPAPVPSKEPRDASRIAYAIYTSGSTGRPKGVAIEHASAASMLAWAATVFPPDQLAGVAAATSICFDLSIFELFLPLSQGGAVILLDDALGLASYEGDLPVTLLNTVPSGISGLLHLEGLPSTVRVVNLAGEPLRRDLVERIYGIPQVERVFNLYGPSEDTTYSTWSEVEQGAELPVTIGRPVAGTAAYVVDRHLQPVGVGVAGELCLAGAGLARNYHRRPARTAGSFVPNPFASPDEAGNRVYRTGDLVRWLPDGRLDFLGRIDHQVKLRGFRIELGEIESALTADPGVEEAVVVVHQAEGSGGDPVLVAYWSPTGEGTAERGNGTDFAPDEEPTDASLKERLGGSLPSYMIPTYFVRLDAFPRTPNGKIDRQALPAPELARAGLASPYRAPSTPTEEGVAEVWRDLMALDRVGADDDLFALGGHSLMATRIAARLRERFSVALAPTDPFERRTVAELAARIDELLAAGDPVADDGVPAPPPLVPYDRSRVEHIPLAFPQEQIWLIHRLDPGNLAYNFQYTIRFAGPLRPEVMLGTLNEIIRRHESLRTTFPSVDGEPRQEIHEPYPAEMPVVDLTALPEERRETVAEALALKLVRHCFDITQLPLMTWTLLKLDEEDHLFVQAEQHFVHDGWSIGRFLGEIEAHYAAFAAGQPTPMPPLEVQFADFSLWQRDWLEGRVMEHQLDYWRRQLADPPPPLEIPTDRPRSPRQLFRGHRLDLNVAPELYADLLAFGRREGWTLFMLMLSAFEVLMARYSGRRDYLLGSGVANRRLKPVEPLIGMVVNTLVLRADLAGEPTFRDLLVRVRRAALGLQEHQDLPFEKLVAELQPERDLSRNPLFQHMFSFHDAPVPDLRFADLKGELLERHNGSAKSDFNVIVKPRGSQRMGREASAEDQVLRVLWEYSTDLFDRTTIERAWGHFNVLLRTLVDHPETNVWHAPMLTAAERQQLTAWNDTAPAVADLDVVAAIGAQGQHRPEASAVVAPDGSLTYGELTDRAGRLAALLQAWGVGPETTVAVAMRPSADMVTAFLGILAAGGAYLPLDADHPADRTAYLLVDSGALALLTDEATAPSLPDFAGRVATVSQALAEAPDDAVPMSASPALDAENLAYVIYTSGTTGRPKGTGVPRRGLANLIAWHVGEYGVTASGRATQIASPAFDACVWELWPYLTQGAAIHIPAPETRMDPRRLYRWLASEGITLSFVPTALAEEMMELVPPADLSLKALLVGGDRLHSPPPPATPFAMVNHYGPTEDSVVATAGRVEAEPSPPPIGRPIAGQQVLLLDRRYEEVPVGVPGQLFIAGGGLARGYLRRPGLTAASFLPNPLARTAGERLYATGDLARRLPDGSLDFLGRIDNQVQVRGLRIELGEIESQLEEHPKVRRAVVVPITVAGRQAAGLAAFVLSEAFSKNEGSEGGSDALAGALTEHLTAQLPGYMVPETITVVPELPQTPNGKVDRKALAERASGLAVRTAREGERIAPRDPGERLIAEIWAEVLGLPSAGALSVHDDFFALGGHSLLAAKAAARVGDAFGMDLELPVLFENRTVARLAEHIAEGLASGEAAEPIRPLPVEERQDGLPLSFSQERLWFVDQLIERRSTYHIARAFACRGALDKQALRAALADVIERHEALRTVFVETDDGPRQRVVPMNEVPVQIRRLDLRPADRSRVMRELIEAPFDLSQPPLLRASLLAEGDGLHTLVLVFHHIASDGWSMPNFASELGTHYAARRNGQSAGLVPLPAQYGDFAVWQRRRLDGDSFERLATFWRRHLEGAPATLEVPTDRPRQEMRSLAGARVVSHLPPEAADAVRAQARRQNATLFMALLAAFSALLGRWAHQDDVVVGTPVAGRPRQEVEDVIGFFVNTLALRTRLGGNPTFEGLLASTRATTLAAFGHQEMPFEQLVELLAPDRNLAQSPLFQATLALATPGEETPQLAGCEVTAQPVERHEAHFELTLFAGERDDGGLDLNFSYDRDLFDASTVERLADHLVRLLDQAIREPRQPLSQLALMSPQDRRQILTDWSGAARDRETATADGPDISLHALVVEQARRRPQAEALVWDGGTLTYGELVAHGAALATRLVDPETGTLAPETRIGVCLERSPELVVSLLAVLMAGGGYVPIDPEFPRERQAMILEDTGAPRVIAKEGSTGRLPAGVETVLCPTISASDGEPPPAAEEVSHPGGDRLAYIMFTSGSTGRPKGVAVPHRGIVRLVRDGRYASFGPQQTYLLAAPAAFDASTFEIWGALANGGRLAVAPAGMLGLDELGACLTRHRVTTLFLTTGLFQQMVEGQLEDLAHLERLLTGGEAMPPAAMAAARADLASTVLVHAYGPTENTTFTTCHRIPPEAAVEADRAVPIGRPIARTQVYILDESMQPVPEGVAGDLYIGGDGLARGYWRRPAMTAAAFVPSPFAGERDEAGSRLYRTGDLACWRPDGLVDFIGRRDGQIKLRGFRIELGEIEAELHAAPQVARAAVMLRDREHLAAYVVPAAGEAEGFDTGALRSRLLQRLPRYMLPTSITALDELPLSSRGKIDRSALPEPSAAVPGDHETVAPRKPLEESLVNIWQDLLKRPRIGVRDDFFALGGHSLLATRLVSRVRDDLGVSLRLHTVFQRPTVEALAAAIEEAQAAVGDAAAAAAPPQPTIQRASRAGRRKILRTSSDGD